MDLYSNPAVILAHEPQAENNLVADYVHTTELLSKPYFLGDFI